MPAAPTHARGRGRAIGAGVAAVPVLAVGGTALALLLPGGGEASTRADGTLDTTTSILTAPANADPGRVSPPANAVCEGLPDVGQPLTAVETPQQLREVVNVALASSVRPRHRPARGARAAASAAPAHRDIRRLANEEARVLQRLGTDLDAGRDPVAASEEAARALDGLAAEANVRFPSSG